MLYIGHSNSWGTQRWAVTMHRKGNKALSPSENSAVPLRVCPSPMTHTLSPGSSGEGVRPGDGSDPWSSLHVLGLCWWDCSDMSGYWTKLSHKVRAYLDLTNRLVADLKSKYDCMLRLQPHLPRALPNLSILSLVTGRRVTRLSF